MERRAFGGGFSSSLQIPEIVLAGLILTIVAFASRNEYPFTAFILLPISVSVLISCFFYGLYRKGNDAISDYTEKMMSYIENRKKQKEFNVKTSVSKNAEECLTDMKSETFKFGLKAFGLIFVIYTAGIIASNGGVIGGALFVIFIFLAFKAFDKTHTKMVKKQHHLLAEYIVNLQDEIDNIKTRRNNEN